VQAELEDDYHCMSVTIYHDGHAAENIEIDMRRAPWSTCPGAVAELRQTFAGKELAIFPQEGKKKHNCTHLYDLATLAAGHAKDVEPTTYDIQVTDPVDNQRCAELRRNSKVLLSWQESRFHITEPKEAAGLRLDQLRAWIETLESDLQEPARLLQWGNILANGRVIPLDQQSDAKKMPPSCYSFQPDRAAQAVRIGEIRESSKLVRQCLMQIPDGESKAKVPKKIKPEKGEVCTRVESARGDLSCYLVSDGTPDPYRVRFRTGSFTAMVLPGTFSTPRGVMLGRGS